MILQIKKEKMNLIKFMYYPHKGHLHKTKDSFKTPMKTILIKKINRHLKVFSFKREILIMKGKIISNQYITIKKKTKKKEIIKFIIRTNILFNKMI
jgi:hypothetical protein